MSGTMPPSTPDTMSTAAAASVQRAPGVLRFSVLAWAAWSPERQTRKAWRDWAGIANDAGDDGPLPALPMMLRRRLGQFGQRLIGVTGACAEGLPSARYVLSTRHGELNRALSTLVAIETDGLPSPTDFSMSIHHALLGLLSIHAGNRLGHTALSAGWDSFAGGLLEAAACIAERPDEPVILVHADEPLQEDYARFREADDAAFPLAMALALGQPGSGAANDVTLELDRDALGGTPSACMATDFLRFVLTGAPQARAVGQRTQWIWRRAA
jgi:hypothetical protein